MRKIARFFVGFVAALLMTWAAVTVLGVLAVFDFFPRRWWAEHFRLVFLAHELIAFLPFVFILALILDKVFERRPVLNSIGSVSAAFLVGLGSMIVETPQIVVPSIVANPDLYIAFLLGVPVTIYAINCIRTWHTAQAS